MDTMDARHHSRPAPAAVGRRDPEAWLAYLALAAGSVAVAFPFYWMIVTALKSPLDLFDLRLVPTHPTLDSFTEVLTRTQFPRWFGNSLLVAIATTASVAFFDSLVGYTLAKLRFPGRGLIFVMILATLMIPTEMLIIPWYIMSSARGWINTYWGIMFPGLISAFGIFLIRQFMQTLPNELFEAARMDGASERYIFPRIVIPLVLPGIVCLSVFAFRDSWNDYFWQLIALKSTAMMTFPLGVAGLLDDMVVEYGLLLAGSTVASLPIIVLFLAFQRQFTAGIAMSAIKG